MFKMTVHCVMMSAKLLLYYYILSSFKPTSISLLQMSHVYSYVLFPSLSLKSVITPSNKPHQCHRNEIKLSRNIICTFDRTI